MSYLILVMMPFALVTNLPILSRDLFGWTPAQVAPLFVIFGIMNLLDQVFLLRWLTLCFGEIRLAMLGSFLAACAFLVFALVPIIGMAPLLPVAVFLFALGQPLAVTAIAGSISRFVNADVQGSTQGGLQALQALGGIFAPLGMNFLYGSVSASTPYWLGMILLLLSGLFIMLAISSLRDAREQEESP